MYTDKAYLVRDRFHNELNADKNVNTLFRGHANAKKSTVCADVYPLVYGRKTIRHCPIGLENLYYLDKVYLIKRLDMFQDDIFNDYKGELIDENGNRIFLITSAAHHFSDEVVHYAKHKAVKIKGKVNFGALNYAGIQLFEIYGDPEKVIRVGPSSGLWGEIQVIPGDVWSRIHCNCCCIEIGHKTQGDTGEAEIRVVVLKKDNRAWVATDNQKGSIFKQVYTLRGKISHGCQMQEQQSFLYKKTFDLQIYVQDPFSPKQQEEEEEEEDSDEDDEEETEQKMHKKLKPAKNTEPQAIGRICSQALHQKLSVHLPIIEFPPDMSVYDKLTLMGTFFLFNLKI